MAVTAFGIDLTVNSLRRTDEIGELVGERVKKREERMIMERFLKESSRAGRSRIEELKEASRCEAYDAETFVNSREAVFDFYRKQLKTLVTDKRVSVYQDLVLQVVEREADSANVRIATNMRKGRGVAQGEMPATFPGRFKTAESVVLGKLKSDLGKRQFIDYFQRMSLSQKIGNISRDMFFAINNGLTGEQVLRFMGVVYDLNKLETGKEVSGFKLKRYILEAISSGEILDLVHVKCLRFVYPKKGGVEILTDTRDLIVEGVNGKYMPKSEERLFERLIAVRSIFDNYDVQTRFTICCSDEDLDLLFPEEGGCLSQEQLDSARDNAKKYMEKLKRTHGSKFNFTSINELAGMGDGKYQNYRRSVLGDILNSGGRYVDPDYFEKDRVDHQYTYYQQLLGSGYSRTEARRSVAEQTASVIALGELLNPLGERIVLIEENRYGENKLIANGQMPLIFVKLRDEAKFGIK